MWRFHSQQALIGPTHCQYYQAASHSRGNMKQVKYIHRKMYNTAISFVHNLVNTNCTLMILCDLTDHVTSQYIYDKHHVTIILLTIFLKSSSTSKMEFGVGIGEPVAVVSWGPAVVSWGPAVVSWGPSEVIIGSSPSTK